MRFATYLTTLALTANSALAAMNLIHNKCDFDVWFSSVGSHNPDSPTLLAAGDYITEAQYYDGTGTALKFTREPEGLWTGQPVLHFSYSYKAGESIYYGISTNLGFDFGGDKIVLHGDQPDAPEIVWNGEPKPDFTAGFLKGELNLEFTMCA
jgi:hypothetical protein